MSSPLRFALAVTVAVAGFLLWKQYQGDDGDPVIAAPDSQPQMSPERPPPPAMPELVQPAPDLGPARYREAVADQVANPGETAFRAYSDAFFDSNRQAAEEHARTNGLTLDEARELTYFGLLAQQTMAWEHVEELVPVPVAADARKKAADVMYAHSEEMKRVVKRLNDSGASAAERAAAIRVVQDSYLAEYYAITGMNPRLLDLLMARGAGVTELAQPSL